MRSTVNKMHSIKYIRSFANPDQAGFEGLGGGGPYVEIPYFQPSISRKGPTTSPSTKLALKYIEAHPTPSHPTPSHASG